MIASAFAALLLLALALDLGVTREARVHEAEAGRFQAQIEALRTTLVQPDGRQESETALAEASMRSESVVARFQRFQDDTSQEVWLSRAALGKDDVLTLEGCSLTREGPLNLAQAMGQARSLSESALSELAEADWQGERPAMTTKLPRPGLSPRDRKLLLAFALFVEVVLLYLLLIDPALTPMSLGA